MLPIGPINAATPTPLKEDGTLDAQSARRLCRRWIDVGLDGVLLLGSMGEGPLLSEEVRNAFVARVLEEVGGKLTLFVSAADRTREKMCERARRYAAMGASCVVLCLPPQASVHRAIADVKHVADCCPVPGASDDVPSNTGIPLNLYEILDILSHPNIVTMKDSSANALLAQGITAKEYRVPGVFLLDGCEYRTAFSAALGYDGVVHGGGVLTARKVRCTWNKATAGLMREAVDLDRENSLFLGTVYNRFSRPLQNIIGQKYALKVLGVFDHVGVAADQSLDDESRVRIERAVEQNRTWLVDAFQQL
jgi:dihydrodipicolinate synthase/N-acetylneuraminate lyase